MYIKEDGRIYITDENGTSYALSLKALLGFMYWCYMHYDSDEIEEGRVKFASAISKFLEESATDYFNSELY